MSICCKIKQDPWKSIQENAESKIKINMTRGFLEAQLVLRAITTAAGFHLWSGNWDPHIKLLHATAKKTKLNQTKQKNKTKNNGPTKKFHNWLHMGGPSLGLIPLIQNGFLLCVHTQTPLHGGLCTPNNSTWYMCPFSTTRLTVNPLQAGLFLTQPCTTSSQWTAWYTRGSVMTSKMPLKRGKQCHCPTGSQLRFGKTP